MKEQWLNIYDWDGFRYRITYFSARAATEDKNNLHSMKLLYRIHVRIK